MTDRELMQQALEALNRSDYLGWQLNIPIIKALRERLAQPVQEPVAVVEITYGREPECYVTGNIDDFPEGVFKLYAAPVRTKDLTDVEGLQDAMTKSLKKAFQLGQTYFQQADSESYAANKRADITLELYRKLEDDTRAVIAPDREKNKC